MNTTSGKPINEVALSLHSSLDPRASTNEQIAAILHPDHHELIHAQLCGNFAMQHMIVEAAKTAMGFHRNSFRGLRFKWTQVDEHPSIGDLLMASNSDVVYTHNGNERRNHIVTVFPLRKVVSRDRVQHEIVVVERAVYQGGK